MNLPGAAIRRTLGVRSQQLMSSIALHILILHISTSLLLPVVLAQQPYLDNLQLDCYVNHTQTLGYTCNGASSCTSYLTFRSAPPTYASVPSIAFLLSAKESDIATANNVTDVTTFPAGHVVLVPVSCNCSSVYTATGSSDGGVRRERRYYQHNATYTLKTKLETYLTVANDTYGGLTTCQAMMAQNPVDSYKLTVGLKLAAPLMCACPSRNQSAQQGFNYVVSYMADVADDVSSIAERFGVDEQIILDANELTAEKTIFPYNPILVPLKSRPSSKLNLNPISPSPPPPPPPPPAAPSTGEGEGGGGNSSKWVFVGVGIGVSLLIIVGLLLCFFLRRRRRRQQISKDAAVSAAALEAKGARKRTATDGLAEYKAVAGGVGSGGKDNTTTSNSWSISSSGVRYAIESLTVYKFDELQKATGNFSESSRIKGSSVYIGYFKGDPAAVKMMKADVSGEINILKQINHSSIVRLSGFCVHGGNTYLVYEYAEKGCLQDWLLLLSRSDSSNDSITALSWKQRVQIAHDMADGLNYLHNYSNPPYIHKNLTSGNVMLDGKMRAKMTNFGLARSISSSGGDMDMHLTRHVVGTKGYLAPEFMESGVVTPKLDIFAFGMILGELLSGRVVSAGGNDDHHKGGGLTASSVRQLVVEGEDARAAVRRFIDPALGSEYPLDLACLMAHLAKDCLHPDLNSRPSIADLLTSLSKIRSVSMDWDPSTDVDSTTLSQDFSS